MRLNAAMVGRASRLATSTGLVRLSLRAASLRCEHLGILPRALTLEPDVSQAESRWRNRTLDHAFVRAELLVPHPLNWRLHPAAQASAVAAALERIGWVQSVVYNRRTNRLLDGHLRVELARERGELVPVGYVDLDEDEERLVLATFDPLGSLAEIDAEKLAELLADVDVDDEGLADLLDSMRQELPSAVEFKEYDEDVERDVQYVTCPHCGKEFPK
jgi:hypothetical protein